MSNFTHSKWQEKHTHTRTQSLHWTVKPTHNKLTNKSNQRKRKCKTKQTFHTSTHTHTFIVIPIHTQSRNKELNSIEGREEKKRTNIHTINWIRRGTDSPWTNWEKSHSQSTYLTQDRTLSNEKKHKQTWKNTCCTLGEDDGWNTVIEFCQKGKKFRRTSTTRGRY